MAEMQLTSVPVVDHGTAAIEQVLLNGDLAKLTSPQRIAYYNKVCESVGLNPLTQPFEFINLNGKLRLYALKSCTEQLRQVRRISLSIVSREVVDGCYIVTTRARDMNGREDESTGAVPIDNKKGEDRANAMMKAETKAKRRVTLSICGLGMLDESEVDSARGSEVKPFNTHPLPGLPKNHAETVNPVTGEVTPIRNTKKRTNLLARAHIIRDKLKISDEIWKGRLSKSFGVESSGKLTESQLEQLVAALEAAALKDAEARSGAAQMAAEQTVGAAEQAAEAMMTDIQRQLIESAMAKLDIAEHEVAGWHDRMVLSELTEKEADQTIVRLSNMIANRQANEVTP